MSTTVIWDRVRQVRKGPRPGHTLADITRAAMALGDAKGIAAVSIRAVAAELDAGAASLYRYIERKDDLYDLMVDAVAKEYDLPTAPTGDWTADVGLIAGRMRAAYGRHPWMAEIAPHASWGPSTQDYLEFFLAALEPTGLDHPARIEFIGLMSAWIATFTQLAEQPTPSDGAVARLQHFAAIAGNRSRPHLADALGALMRADPASSSPDRLFERGLHRLLHGIPG